MSLVEYVFRDLSTFDLQIENLELKDSGVTALWGSSGSGKTTLLRCLLGLDPQAQVRWIFQGQDLGSVSVQKRGLGVVFQTDALFPHMSVQSNILFPLGRKPPNGKTLSLLKETMGLGPLWLRSVQELSGGERQRVALARALIAEPKMLFLDEPFSALDEALRTEVSGMVKALVQRLDIPVLLVTHSLLDVERLASEVLVLEQGRIVSQTSVAEFRQSW